MFKSFPACASVCQLAYRLGYGCAALLVVCSLYFGSTGHPLRSDILFATALVVLVGAFLIFYKSNRESGSGFAQLCLCYIPFTLLWLLSVVSPYSTKNAAFIILGVLAFVVPSVALFVALSRSGFWNRACDWMSHNYPILLVIGVFAILSFDTFSQTAVCDSFLYFNASAEAMHWDFTLKDPELFKFCSHQSYSVALWYMIGGFLLPLDPAGQRLINIVLISSAVLCFYTVVLKLGFFKKHQIALSTLSAALFAANPLILGIIFEIDLDIPSVAFYVWLIAAYVHRKNILFVYSAFSLALCKEIGVVLLFGFGAGWLVGVLAQACREKLNPWLFIRRQSVVPVAAVLSSASFLALYLLTPRWMSGSEKAEAAKEAGMNIFLINFDNIVMKLKELYLLNFSWLLVAIAVIAFGVWITRKIRHASISAEHSRIESHAVPYGERPLIAPIVCSYVAFVAFNMVYLTYLNPRYIMCHIVGLTLLAVCSLSYITQQRSAAYGMCTSILILLMLAQSFFTIDPVTLRFFKNIDTGEGTIVTTRIFYQSPEGRTTDPYLASSRELMHGASYNRQYCYVGTAFETVLKDIGYDSDTMVIVDPVYDKLGTYIAFFGKWGSDKDEYYFNPDTGQVQQLAGPEKLNVVVVSENTKIDLDDYRNYEKVYFVTAPYRAEFETRKPIDGLVILDSGTSVYRQWLMEYYRLK